MPLTRRLDAAFVSLPLVFLLVLVAAPAAAETEGSCVADANTLCLQSDRFKVEVDWDDTVSSGQGLLYPLSTDDTGFFYYQDSRYVDLMLKVIDGCTLTDTFWLFSTGLSDSIQTITITDTLLGGIETFDNALGEFPTFIDLDSLPCNPPFTRPFPGPSSLAPPPETTPARQEPPRRTSGHKGTAPTTLTLLEGRFRVELEWRDFDSNSGPGFVEPITDHSGAFYFFDPANYELILKIIDGTSDNGFFWLFYGATTNIEYEIQITDVCTGSFESYFHPLGDPGGTTADTMAFGGGTGACDIFADGFESGDTSQWSLTIPP